MVLQRLILREVAAPLAAALLVMVQLLVVLQLVQMNDLLLGSGLDGLAVARIFLFLAPYYAAFAVPPALLLGVLLGFGRLAEDRELVAAAGLGRSPLAYYPVPLAIGAVLSALVAFLAQYGQPWGLQNVRREVDRLVERSVVGGIEPGTFHEQVPNLMLRLGAIPSPGTWESVLLEDRSQEGAPTLLTARRGHVEKTGHAGALVLRLEDGELHAKGPDGRYARTSFASGTVPLSIDGALAKRNGFRHPVKSLYPAQVLEHAQRLRDQGLDRAARETLVHYHRGRAESATCLVLALVAVPIAATGRRTRAGSYVVTIGAYVLYYATMTVGHALGASGQLSPALGAWMANLVAAAAGLALAVRLTRAPPASGS
jgi:lipopolysaccharide export system permease protein